MSRLEKVISSFKILAVFLFYLIQFGLTIHLAEKHEGTCTNFRFGTNNNTVFKIMLFCFFT